MVRYLTAAYGKRTRPLAKDRGRYVANKKAKLDQIARQMTAVTPHSTVPPLEQKPGEYVSTLIDPEGATACIIPDISSYPTTCFTCQETLNIVTNAQGCRGMLIRLFPDAKWQQENGTSSDSAYTYDASFSFSFANAMQANYQGVRLVAASCRVEFTGTDQNNSGSVIATAFANSNIDFAWPTSMTNQRDTRGTYVGPARHGAYLTYRPADATNLDFHLPTSQGYSFGSFLVHISGGGVGGTGIPVSPFNIIVTTHWEAIPKTTTKTAKMFLILYFVIKISKLKLLIY